MEGDFSIRHIVAANVKKYRKLSNMTQDKLAEKADISTTYVANIECGKTWISDKTLEKISKSLHIETYQLFIPEDYERKTPRNRFRNIRTLIEKDRQAFHSFADSFCDKILTDIHQSF